MDETTTQNGQSAPAFIGPKKVTNFEILPDKHNGTIELAKVTYDDGTTETMTTKLYAASVTPESTDLTTLRDHRCTPILEELLQVLLSYGTPLADINYLVARLPLAINMSIGAANAKLWGKPESDINLIELDKILKEKVTLNDIIPKDQDQA